MENNDTTDKVYRQVKDQDYQSSISNTKQHDSRWTHRLSNPQIQNRSSPKKTVNSISRLDKLTLADQQLLASPHTELFGLVASWESFLDSLYTLTSYL
jgi:hypothetical protein